MRRSIIIVFVIILALCMTECDPGMFSLFPRFLTTVTHTANAGDYFTHVDGEKFYFYSMHSDYLGTDILYVIQAPASGDRKVAIYNSLCHRLGTFSSPVAGAAHLPLPSDYHLVGRVIIDLIELEAGNVFFDDVGTFPENPDHHLAFDGGTGYEYWTDDDIMGPNFYWRSAPYNGPGFQVSPPPDLYGPIGFDFAGRYALEAVDSNMVDAQITMVFRRTETNEIFTGIVSTSPPASIPFNTSFQPFKMVPETVNFSKDNYFVVQKYNGYLVRMNEASNFNGQYPAEELNEFLIAYSPYYEDYMYLFSPNSLSLFRTQAWWQDHDWKGGGG